MLHLHDLRLWNMFAPSARDFYTIIEAGFSLPPEEYLKLLTNLTGALDGNKATAAKDIPVLVSGSIVEQMWIFDLLEAAGGQVVAETYSAAWSIRLDTSNPLEALAMESLQSYPMVSCVSMTRRKEMVLKACRDYHIDGVILHSNKSCLPITLGQMDIKRALQQELGVPSVVIEADHMDPANFSLSQFEDRAGSFMEMLLERKGGRP